MNCEHSATASWPLHCTYRLLAVCFSLEISAGIVRRHYLALLRSGWLNTLLRTYKINERPSRFIVSLVILTTNEQKPRSQVTVIFRYILYHHQTENTYKIRSLNSYTRFTQENICPYMSWNYHQILLSAGVKVTLREKIANYCTSLPFSALFHKRTIFTSLAIPFV